MAAQINGKSILDLTLCIDAFVEVVFNKMKAVAFVLGRRAIEDQIHLGAAGVAIGVSISIQSPRSTTSFRQT